MTAYEELFKSVTDPGAVDSDNALLDYLHEKESRRLGGLIGDERLKIHNQVDSLQATRDRNTKVIALGDKINQFLPKLDPSTLAVDKTPLCRKSRLRTPK